MSAKLVKNRRVFEMMLIIAVFGLACLALGLGEYKLVVLNLFYLPVILSGYYLGRGTTCVLALLSALAITIVTALDPGGLAVRFTPVIAGIALALWAAVLGLSAILIGTLCDERAVVLDELHEAYVGVVEVLSRYLQGANPNNRTRSIRVAELAQLIATEMKLPRKHVDEIRVGALLYDLGNVEITTRVIARAVDTLESAPSIGSKHTFAGMDLVHSLGTVLQGTVPLLLGQDDYARGELDLADSGETRETPVGAMIIRVARAYVVQAGDSQGQHPTRREHALSELRRESNGEYDANILRALERVVQRGTTGQRSATHMQPQPV